MVKCIKGKKGDTLTFNAEQREEGNPQTYYIWIKAMNKAIIQAMCVKLLETAAENNADLDTRPMNSLIKLTQNVIATEGKDDMEVTYDEIVSLGAVTTMVEQVLDEKLAEIEALAGGRPN